MTGTEDKLAKNIKIIKNTIKTIANMKDVC
jgi:hypothetical protein